MGSPDRCANRSRTVGHITSEFLMPATSYIDLEKQLGANNYKPVDSRAW
jgi:hypothetical protein